MNWSEQQSAALTAVETWFRSKDRKQVFRVFGFAGTGKTTLAKYFAESIDNNVAYAAYTGKAALMMRNNGCKGASTIHSLIYKAEEDDDGNITFKLNKNSLLKTVKLLIIDECSMVDEDLAKDLLSFNKPILVLGDPAQLPPVNGAGYFTNADPDVMLTEIHRQAEDNPIVYLATRVREGKTLIPGNYGDSIISGSIDSVEPLIEYDQVLVGRNATRTGINSIIRNMLGYIGPMPQKNDRLICLKNDKLLGILNGEMFNVQDQLPSKSQSYGLYKLTDVDTESKILRARIHHSFFDTNIQKPNPLFLKGSQEFDYGYCISCHKAQGSQWNNVLIYDESWCFREDKFKWLYTAITRAQSKILVYQT